MVCPSEAKAAMPGRFSWWSQGFVRAKFRGRASRAEVIYDIMSFIRSVAQLVEQRSPKPPVGGSSPS
jgi:hypothetical protein